MKPEIDTARFLKNQLPYQLQGYDVFLNMEDNRNRRFCTNHRFQL